MTASVSIRHVPSRSRYEAVVEGEVVGIAEYRLSDRVAVMHHTLTDVEHRGQGIAAQLVRAALDDLRQRDLQVVPTCWYVADFIAAHPEYQDLLAAE
jgi:predicted GNAT family acetyltransferase